MSTELMTVEYESLSGIPVKLDAQTVRTQLTRGNGKVTDQEILFFLRTCQARKLDPFEDGEVYIIKYSDDKPATTVVGYQAYVRRADKFPEYGGYKAGITVIRDGKDVIQKEGCCVYKQLKETLIGGWCRVFKIRPNGRVEEYFTEVSLEEYSSGKSNWNSKPATMIRKCAISQAFRSAFPNEYEGLYTVDEMQAAGAIPVDYEDCASAPTETVVGKAAVRITQEQRKQMFAAVKTVCGDSDEATKLLKDLVEEEGFSSSAEVTEEAFKNIMDKLQVMADEIAEQGEGEENEDN